MMLKLEQKIKAYLKLSPALDSPIVELKCEPFKSVLV
jgi:hypothetical protein